MDEVCNVSFSLYVINKFIMPPNRKAFILTPNHYAAKTVFSLDSGLSDISGCTAEHKYDTINIV